MPPTLALILCIIFVAVLLRVERQRNPAASKALWISTFWMLICGSRPVASWFELSTRSLGSMEEGSAIDRFVLGGLLLVALLVIYRRKLDYYNIVKYNACVFVVYILIGSSILWADFPYVSFKRWIRILGSIVMALLILSEQNPFQALESVFRRVSYILLPFSLLLIKYFPNLGVEYDAWTGTPLWVGVSTQKNGLGQICTLLSSVLIWATLQKWRNGEIFIRKSHTYADVFIICLAFFLLRGIGGAYSATSIALLVITIAVLMLINQQESIRTGLIANHLKSLMVIFIITVIFVMETMLPNVSSLLGRDETLTGRTQFWNGVLKVAYRHPFLGVGFGSYWGVGDESSSLFTLSQAHNGYLGVFLELGIFGLVLLLAFLLSFCRKVQVELKRSFDLGVLGVCFLVIVILYNISESSFFQANFLWTSFVFMSIILSAPRVHSNLIGN